MKRKRFILSYQLYKQYIALFRSTQRDITENKQIAWKYTKHIYIAKHYI